MPSVEKRGKVWRARAMVDGAQIAAGTHRTKSEALAAAVEIERKAKGGNVAGAHGKLVRDVLERYSAEVSPSKSGRVWEQRRLAALCREEWAALPADRRTPDVLGKYRDRRLKDVTGATVIREFNLLSAVFKRATKEWGWMNSNPLSDVSRPKDSTPRTRRLREGELEALRIASGYRPDGEIIGSTQMVVAMSEFAVETAMRSGEICSLTWEHVHPRHVHLPRTKNDTARDVPLSPRALQILAQVPRTGEKVFDMNDALRDGLWRKVRDRAGITDLTFHDLRREATSRLAKQYDVLRLAKITGHNDLMMLLHE